MAKRTQPQHMDEVQAYPEEFISPAASGTIHVDGDETPPQAPASVQTTNKVGKVTVSWGSVPDNDLERYKVYYGTTGGFSTASAFGTDTADVTSYDHSSEYYGTTFSYKVSAIDYSKNESGLSSEVSGSPQRSGSQDLDSSSVTNQKLVDGAVIESKIAASAVSTNKLVDEAVSAPKVAGSAITETKISDNAITTPKIAANAVEAGEIAASAVTTVKLAASAVTANEIAANAVEAVKIAASAVTTNKITAGAVDTNELAASAVTANQIEASAITTTKLEASAVVANKMAVGTLSAITANMGHITAGYQTFEDNLGNTIMELGESVLGSDQHGILINDDAGSPVLEIGEISSGTYGIQELETSSGDKIVDGGNWLGAPGLSIAQADDGTYLYGFQQAADADGASQTYPIADKNFTVPTGKQWVVLCTFVDNYTGIDTNWNMQYVDGWIYNLAGYFRDENNDRVGQELSSGSYTNYDIVIQHSSYFEDDAGNVHGQEADLFYRVYEMPT